jgi:hypothetical protein
MNFPFTEGLFNKSWQLQDTPGPSWDWEREIVTVWKELVHFFPLRKPISAPWSTQRTLYLLRNCPPVQEARTWGRTREKLPRRSKAWESPRLPSYKYQGLTHSHTPPCTHTHHYLTLTHTLGGEESQGGGEGEQMESAPSLSNLYLGTFLHLLPQFF